MEQSEDAKSLLSKLGFPEVEGDMAPSAIVPGACRCLQKHATKLDQLLASFISIETAGKSLTPLQSRPAQHGCF